MEEDNNQEEQEMEMYQDVPEKSKKKTEQSSEQMGQEREENLKKIYGIQIRRRIRQKKKEDILR